MAFLWSCLDRCERSKVVLWELKTISGIHGVIDPGHEILTRYEALTRAHHAGLDLVEVGKPNA